MRLIEIFCSLQGEGPAMGRPATFVRLAGCNLICAGCDTQVKQWQEQSPKSVLQSIKGPRVVITGGEPTIQEAELSELIRMLHKAGKEIHIETNGTNPLPDDVLERIHCIVVSPKRGSDFHMAYWAGKENVHFKFVLGVATWCWSPGLLEDLIAVLPRQRVWIMAYGTDQNLPEAKNAWDLALRLGVNYSDRLHIRLRKR